jgi:hypothetical protein
MRRRGAVVAKDEQAQAGKAKPLNEQNWPRLAAVVGVNIVIFGVLTALDPTPLLDLAKPWKFLLPAGASLALISVLNGLLRGNAKARLVFPELKIPLPGSEAYTVHAKNDPRFTEAEVLAIFNPDAATLADPQRQNAHWYANVFQPLQDRPAVLQAEQNFLFRRDYAAFSVMMLVVLGGAGYFLITPVLKWLGYCAFLLVQYVLVALAARHSAVETVTNAFAQAVSTKKLETTAASRVDNTT